MLLELQDSVKLLGNLLESNSEWRGLPWNSKKREREKKKGWVSQGVKKKEGMVTASTQLA